MKMVCTTVVHNSTVLVGNEKVEVYIIINRGDAIEEQLAFTRALNK